MKRSEMSRSKGVSLVAGAVLALCVGLSLAPAGCGSNDFLGLEDYQRDLLVWLVHSSEDASGLACWDLNGNGVADPQEDQNGDGLFNDLDCQGLRCWDLNGNGVEDPEEDQNGDGLVNVLDCQGLRCWDLNGNGVEDPEEDINGDGIIDARDCGVELVFVLDTSDSMRDDMAGLFAVIERLIRDDIVVRSTLFGIIDDLDPEDCWDRNRNGVGDPEEDTNGDGTFDELDCLNIADEFRFRDVNAKEGRRCTEDPPDTCVSKNVKDDVLTCIEGTDECELDDNEDWGPATAIVAERFDWLPGVVKIVIPISDEDPEDSPDVEEGCEDSDLDAINEVIRTANENQVFVIPIVAEVVLEPPDSEFEACVSNLAKCLADGTGANSVKARFPSAETEEDHGVEINRVVQEVLDAITNAVTRRTVFPDCNDNGTPDACDIADETSEDANRDGVPDECDGG